MPAVKANGININYESHGTGEPLVMINGYGGNLRGWDIQVPFLSKKYCVITLDNRGTGHSDKPDIPYTIRMMADDVAGLLDALNIDAAHICGFSMGGAIAQEFAINYPQRVISLILGCSGFGGSHETKRDPAVDAQLLNMKNFSSWTPEYYIREILPGGYTEEFINKNLQFIKEMIKHRSAYPATPSYVYERQAKAVLEEHDTYDRLNQIKAPTLILVGSADPLSPLENSRILASRIPNSELVILENLRHAFNIEAAEKTNNLILDFLNRHRRTTKE